MPKAKYQKEARGLYYTYEKTGLYKPDGKPEYKRLTAKTQKRLDEKVAEYRSSIAFGVNPNTITVAEWYATWFDSYKSKCKETSQKWYRQIYKNHIEPAIGAMRLTNVREANLQAILSRMAAQDYSVKTVKSVRSVLFGMFDKAQANRLIVTNPAQRLVAAGRAQKHRRALTPEERTAYLAACRTHPFGRFAAFLYFFGLRRGEALALNKSDVVFGINRKPVSLSVTKQFVYPDNNMPVVSTVKTTAGERTLPIPEKALDYIDFGNLPDGLLFGSADSSADGNPAARPLSYSEIVDRWTSFIRFALGDDTDVTMHVLRHNYCTMLFENGVDVMTVRYLMGHEDIKTTLEIYAHYTETIKQNDFTKAVKIG